MKSQKFCDYRKPTVQNRTKKKHTKLKRSKSISITTASTDETMVQHKIVVADIGGTNARFQAWSIDFECGDALDFEKIYQTRDYPQFTDVFEQFVKDSEITFFDAACFAVAGPVSENRCKMTNLGWDVCADTLLKYVFVDKISIINDFVANGYGVLELDQKDLFTLNQTPVRMNGPIAILGPGTGLGVKTTKSQHFLFLTIFSRKPSYFQEMITILTLFIQQKDRMQILPHEVILNAHCSRTWKICMEVVKLSKFAAAMA